MLMDPGDTSGSERGCCGLGKMVLGPATLVIQTSTRAVQEREESEGGRNNIVFYFWASSPESTSVEGGEGVERQTEAQRLRQRQRDVTGQRESG